MVIDIKDRLLVHRNKEVEEILAGLCAKDYRWASALHKRYMDEDWEVWREWRKEVYGDDAGPKPVFLMEEGVSSENSLHQS